MDRAEARLAELERTMRDLRDRLDVIAAPLRVRMEALGPPGLYALAADEAVRAEHEYHHQRRRLHLEAARAAETLADRLVAQR
jgi:hypothetical protein